MPTSTPPTQQSTAIGDVLNGRLNNRPTRNSHVIITCKSFSEFIRVAVPAGHSYNPDLNGATRGGHIVVWIDFSVSNSATPHYRPVTLQHRHRSRLLLILHQSDWASADSRYSTVTFCDRTVQVLE